MVQIVFKQSLQDYTFVYCVCRSVSCISFSSG